MSASAPDWLDETPRPPVFSGCFRCRVTEEDIDNNLVVVGPRGTAHFGMDYGATKCGHDATGPRWWWPL